MLNDWRLTNQMNYLFRAILIKDSDVKGSTSDHDHCEFCWIKSVENNISRPGYYTKDRYRWICKQCYEDFKEMFAWDVEDFGQNS